MGPRFLSSLFLACLVGCGEADVTIQSAQNDLAEMALASVPELPFAPVCTEGPFRCFALVRTDEDGKIARFGDPAGLTPADLANAYQLTAYTDPKATVAVVLAYGYSKAESDLAMYRGYFGLPACTRANGCLKIVNQDGQGSPLPHDPPASNDWTIEGALDLDMVSAGCPKCHILMIQANDAGESLLRAQATAVRLGATVISNSWGWPERDDNLGSAYDHYFNHPGVGIFAAAGDNGYNDAGSGPDYPGVSAYVTAVGGTKLVQSSDFPRGWVESAWGIGSSMGGAGGSACSLSIAKPPWQTSSPCAKRASADVAAVGDPDTGVSVYNAANTGWLSLGGTSAAAPFVAAVYALTGHGNEGPWFAYERSKSFNDVIMGVNGVCGNILCTAKVGWDGPTGVGTPNASALARAQSSGGPPAGWSGSDGCVPSCSGRQCGSDGCGGSCGRCVGYGAFCNASGQCATSSGSCPHAVCTTGLWLPANCDPCVTKVCSAERSCCTSTWDASCLSLVDTKCGISC
jgi:hypothetical protein